jgi:hypothetical protein
MKTTTIITAVALVLATAGTVSAISVSEKAGTDLGLQQQDGFTGTSFDCLDWNVLYLVDGVHSPLAEDFEVTPGAGWSASSDDGVVLLDFFDANGVSVAWSVDESGTVPDDAAYAIACVALEGLVPVPGATFTYSE